VKLPVWKGCVIDGFKFLFSLFLSQLTVTSPNSSAENIYSRNKQYSTNSQAERAFILAQ
jgi:hypothetical protein